MNFALCIFAALGCTNSQISVELSADEQETILKAHNDLRSSIAKGTYNVSGTIKPTAANMRKLKWDPKLATSAQEWATYCPKENDISILGENIYMSLSMESRTIEELISNATKLWEKEFQDNGWPTTTMEESGFTSAIRHATQMAWAETGLIGCSVGRCGTDYYTKEHLATLVCHYGEPGNYVGSDIYVEGDTCSACSDGFRCETDSGLCV
ncbi:hypothetical protein B9Z55_017855 [Caenorhabditis nigoni]|uniref:SCP domain-containing protein n=2 Tax=Caenorhabditis nigoni TaxID=1611254 RepID=A0A2G5TBX6_9PELO|nr:hypothetical protein B9Z55_017855 [Caenorhabditis nigoni]